MSLELEGTTANRAAIGARVTVRLETPAGPRRIHRVVSSGGSFGASTLRVFVGLGDATADRRRRRRLAAWRAKGAAAGADVPPASSRRGTTC